MARLPDNVKQLEGGTLGGMLKRPCDKAVLGLVLTSLKNDFAHGRRRKRCRHAPAGKRIPRDRSLLPMRPPVSLAPSTRVRAGLELRVGPLSHDRIGRPDYTETFLLPS